MKEILDYIEEKKSAYAKLPFFDFLRDRSIPPQQRLAFAPSFSFFVMGFGELNKHAFRVEPTNDPVQVMINQHTYEDDSHWVWFLEDIQKLQMNNEMSLSDSLKFLWRDENSFSRWTTYRLYQLTFQAEAIQKLVIIEAVEATADIFLDLTAQVADELQTLRGYECKYFGQHHFDIDSNHTIHSDEAAHKVEDVPVPEAFRQRAYELVDEVFQLFTDFSDSLHSCCLKTSALKTSEDAQLQEVHSLGEAVVVEPMIPALRVPELAAAK